MKNRNSIVRVALALATFVFCAGSGAEAFRNFEAVDTNGCSIWVPSFPLNLTGVILNDPGEMLDATPDFVPWNNGEGVLQLGGQFQIFVQAVWPGDRGGVECWMGQNYGNLPWLHSSALSYDNSTWSEEVSRVSHDPATGHRFRKGDLVNVTANASLFRGGMQNINEEHSIDASKDFVVSLVCSNYGVPAPEAISLVSVLSTNLGPTGHYDIFDATRTTGGEHWQGMRVRINGLALVNADGWTTNSDWIVRHSIARDEDGRQIPLVHPLYSLGPAPITRFDAIGILLQESDSGTDGTFGYKLFLQEIEPSAAVTLNIETRPVITWPAKFSNYQLQRRVSLNSTNWVPATNRVVSTDGQNAVILEPENAQGFYRLERIQ